jgi:hypothetical protein
MQYNTGRITITLTTVPLISETLDVIHPAESAVRSQFPSSRCSSLINLVSLALAPRPGPGVLALVDVPHILAPRSVLLLPLVRVALSVFLMLEQTDTDIYSQVLRYSTINTFTTRCSSEGIPTLAPPLSTSHCLPGCLRHPRLLSTSAASRASSTRPTCIALAWNKSTAPQIAHRSSREFLLTYPEVSSFILPLPDAHCCVSVSLSRPPVKERVSSPRRTTS